MDPRCRRCGAPGSHPGDGEACAVALQQAVLQIYQQRDRDARARRQPILRRFTIWGLQPIRRIPARTRARRGFPRRWMELLKWGAVRRNRLRQRETRRAASRFRRPYVKVDQSWWGPGRSGGGASRRTFAVCTEKW